jgi:hypothetical protein
MDSFSKVIPRTYLYTRNLCQKNQGTVKIKQKPVAMGDRTTCGSLSPERTPFQNRINGQSHLRKVLRER